MLVIDIQLSYHAHVYNGNVEKCTKANFLQAKITTVFIFMYICNFACFVVPITFCYQCTVLRYFSVLKYFGFQLYLHMKRH